MASKAPDQLQAPEDLLQVRKRLKAAERKGVDVSEAKQLLVRALLAFRDRRLDDMGAAIRDASQAADEGERALREERLRRQVWTLREGGAAPEGLSRVESALAQRNLEEAEAALTALRQGPPRAARRLVAPASVAGLAFESRSFQIVLARPGAGGTLKLVDIRRGEAGPEGLEAAVSAALRGLRPRPQKVHVLLPQDAHVLSSVSLPPALPASEQTQALRWKLAKLCDFPADDALITSRSLSAGKEASVLGLLARPEAVARILEMVRGAGLPVGRILPPAETVHTLLPPTHQREARALVEIGRDTSRLYVFGPGGLALSRDLGVGTSLWLSALETPISSTRGSVKLSLRQAQEVLGRFDISGAENLILEDGTALNDKDLHALLRPSLERLQDALVRSLEFAAGGGGAITQVFLCGEGASLPGLDRVLASRLGCPVSVSVLPLSGCAAPQADGLALAPADALAASLVLAAGNAHAKTLDLAPASTRTEALLDRGLLHACALGFFLSLGFLGLSLFARHCGPGAESSLQDTRERIRIVKQKIDEGNAELASRHGAAPVAPPGGSGAAAAVLRELSLALPPEGGLLGLSMDLPPQGGVLLEISAPPEPDLAPVLARDPLLGGSVAAEPLPLGGIRYHCRIPKERLP